MISRLGPNKLVPSSSNLVRAVAASPTLRRTFSALASAKPTPPASAAQLDRSPRRMRPAARPFSSTARALQAEVVEEGEEAFDLSAVERVSDEVDVCIVGGGPAGLSAAIRIMQKAEKDGKEIRVVVLEKGAEIGQLWLRDWAGQLSTGEANPRPRPLPDAQAPTSSLEL